MLVVGYGLEVIGAITAPWTEWMFRLTLAGSPVVFFYSMGWADKGVRGNGTASEGAYR